MTEPVRIHIRVPGTAPMPELMTLVESIEAAGFDGAGILDSQMIGRDTFVILGQAAARTTRLALFPAVTNPFTRHASVLASAIQTVEEMAPGRIKCVIGTGYSSASTIGRKPATLAEMRACIGAVKSLLAGQTVDWSGTPAGLSYASGRHIPVLMAASGPKAMELAGEIADGVLLLVGFNRALVERALDHVERGAKRSGRRVEDLEIIWAVRTGHGSDDDRGAQDGATGRRALGPTLAGGLARARGHPLAEARGSGCGVEDLSRSLPRARLGGGYRGNVFRAGRGRRRGVRRAWPGRDSGVLRGTHR